MAAGAGGIGCTGAFCIGSRVCAGGCRWEDTLELAQRRMQETTDMLELHHAPVPFPAVQFEDSSQALQKAEKGGVLDLKTLRDLSVLIHVAGAVRRCLRGESTDRACPVFLLCLPAGSFRTARRDRSLRERGRRNAGPGLTGPARRASSWLKGLKQRIRRRVENMVASSRYRELLQEPYYAQREKPVRPADQGRAPARPSRDRP